MKVEIYGKENCIYCTRSKDLLDTKNQSYDYFDVEKNEEAYKRMKERNPTYATLPHIYIDDTFIPGYDGLRDFYKRK